MSAASCIGRIGGLAVALGVGAAVSTGVAWAEPGASPGSPGSTSSSSSSSATSGAAGSSASAPGAGSSTDSATATDTKSRAPSVLVRVGNAPGSEQVTASSQSAQNESTASADSIPLFRTSTPAPPRHSSSPSSSSASSSSAGQTGASAAPAASSEESSNTVVADESVAKAQAFMSNSSVAAARTAAKSSPAPLAAVITPEALVTPAAPAPASMPAPSVLAPATQILTALVNGLDPFAGSNPTGTTDTPGSWVLAAAARREVGIDTLAAASSTSGITYAPVPTLFDGVITNSVPGTSSSGLPLSFTVISAPADGAKVVMNSATGTFSFLPFSTAVQSGGTESFSVLVAETTPIDTALVGLPIVGSLLVQPIITQLYQTPLLNTVLAPFIGQSTVVPVSINVGKLVPDGTPVAFTTLVTSFDGTMISTNYFPASGQVQGDVNPTIFEGPGLGSAGLTDPTSEFGLAGLTPGIAPLRNAGYNVVTWDPRGEYASTGVLQLDNPAYEGRDVQALISWVATQPGVQLDGPNDPRMGMVGGSYGGGIQLVTAGIDNRVDAIVPSIAWNTLNASLYPDAAFKTSFDSLLLLDLVTAGARINPMIYAGIFTGFLTGFLTGPQQALLAASGPDFLLDNITAPTFFIQGTVDVLFPLAQSVLNAEALDANGVPIKMMWFCGGHGLCLDGQNPGQAQLILNDTLAWLDKYVKQDPNAPEIPNFQYVDQNAAFYSSDLFPFDPAFHGTPIVATGAGGVLPLLPILGGSGPSSGEFPVTLGNGSKAINAVNVPVTTPAGTQIVGSPTLTMDYIGFGTSRHVYAQVVDNTTGRVLGNIVTPVPVTLDGLPHQVTIPLSAIVYTAEPGDSLTLQITSSATAFEDFTAFGGIAISDVQVSLPTVAPGVAQPALSQGNKALAPVA
jgi:ABC-2 type transport system ATP-binding protein